MTKIVLELHFEDTVSLKRTSKGLFNRLRTEDYSKIIFEACMRFQLSRSLTDLD